MVDRLVISRDIGIVLTVAINLVAAHLPSVATGKVATATYIVTGVVTV